MKGLRGLAFIFGCFKTSEYGSWIAVTIYANQRGGVREAGAVLVASLVPATLAALGTGNLLVRLHAKTLLAWGMVIQASGLAAMAALVSSQAAPVLATYAAAVVTAIAMVTSRPAISALLPALTPDPRSITRAHVLLGWLDGAATLVGPAVDRRVPVGRRLRGGLHRVRGDRRASPPCSHFGCPQAAKSSCSTMTRDSSSAARYDRSPRRADRVQPCSC